MCRKAYRGLLGASSAGKSTTLKAISDCSGPKTAKSRGGILFDGERIDGIDADRIVRRGIIQVMEGRHIIRHDVAGRICGSAPSPPTTTRSAPTSMGSMIIFRG